MATLGVVESASVAPKIVKRKRVVPPKMRRSFVDLDERTWARKRWKRHRRQRFVRLLRKLAGFCAACGDPSPGSITCPGCLAVDRAYKVTQAVVRKTAKWTDAEGRPFRLRFETRMLPVIGERCDGWERPACLHVAACERELIRACGPKDAPGMSCPDPCSHFELDPKAEVTKRTIGR